MASNPNIVDWFTVTPVRFVGLRRGYFKLKNFLAQSLVWKGASEIVKQYNYSAAKAFTIFPVPSQASGTNYTLCIKYRVGTEVTRYKIWDTGNLLPQVEQYVNQKILPNFCLECWSWENLDNAINPQEYLFRSGEQAVPSDLRDASGFYTTSVEEGVEANLAIALPSGTAPLTLLPDASSAWLDNAAATQVQDVNTAEVSIAAPTFNDAVYILNPADGNYYSVTLTTVDGVTTIVVGETPVTP